MIVKIGAALAALSAIGGTVGYNLPQIATRDAVVEVAGAAQTNANEIIALKMWIKRKELTELRVLEQQMKAAGKPIPTWLLNGKAEAQAEIEALERELK